MGKCVVRFRKPHRQQTADSAGAPCESGCYSAFVHNIFWPTGLDANSQPCTREGATVASACALEHAFAGVVFEEFWQDFSGSWPKLNVEFV